MRRAAGCALTALCACWGAEQTSIEVPVADGQVMVVALELADGALRVGAEVGTSALHFAGTEEPVAAHIALFDASIRDLGLEPGEITAGALCRSCALASPARVF